MHIFYLFRLKINNKLFFRMPHLHFPHVTLNIRSIYFGLPPTCKFKTFFGWGPYVFVGPNNVKFSPVKKGNVNFEIFKFVLHYIGQTQLNRYLGVSCVTLGYRESVRRGYYGIFIKDSESILTILTLTSITPCHYTSTLQHTLFF